MTICSSKHSESEGFDGNFADELKPDRMPYLKDEIPADIAEILRQAEARADECWRALHLRHYPADLAIWAVLTGGIRMVEGEQATRGSNTPHFDAMLANLSRLLAVAVKWAIGHGQPPADPPRRWTGELSAAVDQALRLAKDYAHFEVCFQGFHKGRYAADVLSPSLIRFSVPGSERDHQVSAYQKGLRPREGRFTGQRAAQRPQEPRVVEAFEQALGTCRATGSLGFEYGDPWPLWRELMPEYKDRVTALARRADTLSLGDYTLAEFNAFYVALIVICAAHDHLCFLWARANGVYPLESAVIVRSTAAWTNVLSRLSGLAPEKCRPMIADLTSRLGSQSISMSIRLSRSAAPMTGLHSRRRFHCTAVTMKTSCAFARKGDRRSMTSRHLRSNRRCSLLHAQWAAVTVRMAPCSFRIRFRISTCLPLMSPVPRSSLRN